MGPSLDGAGESLVPCARFSDQTKVPAWFCVAVHCRLCAQPLDAKRGLAFRISRDGFTSPIGLHCVGARPR